MIIAIPLAGGKLAAHFGHCQEFALLDVQNNEVQSKQLVEPPAHEPGVLPRWLSEQGVTVIIAGGMGQRALTLFNQYGINVVVGAPAETPEDLIQGYLDDSLATGVNLCDH